MAHSTTKVTLIASSIACSLPIRDVMQVAENLHIESACIVMGKIKKTYIDSIVIH